MSSLRDQLLGLGFKSAPKPQPSRQASKPAAKAPQGKGKSTAPQDASAAKPQHKARAGNGEVNLAHAYAMRAQTEKAEREQAEREKQEAARLRKQAQAKFDAWLKTIKPLNDAAAEIARHFEYGGKIKRIYVTEAQLKALNAGELGVIQRKGNYMLVTAAQVAEAQSLFGEAVALRIDPNAPVQDDPYSDPKYQVPDDLVW